MSAFFEFEGKTIKEAIKNASKELNIKEENIDHDVLSFGSTGIFGLVGAKKARIRVTVSERPTREKNLKKEKISGNQETKREEEKTEKHEPKDEQIEKGKEYLKKITENITDIKKIAIRQKNNRVYYDISCEKPALLIGKRGQTLEAIQYLVEKIVNNQREKRIKIKVDIEGYIKEKRNKLEMLAKKTADQVKEQGKSIALGNMNSGERRIVHLALKDEKEVRTKSIGNGHIRKILVLPKKKKSKTNKKEKNGK